ncbi:MAG TPA: EF-P beta-lysylation protein EpmB [Gammaproteobacteria bacterium]|nr:EF-P beta-lysylation protein EpmB [Gammaproteobacteria bacterium]
MVQPNPVPVQRPAWQLALQNAVRDPAELLRELALPPSLAGSGPRGLAFPLRVPRSYVGRMRKGDPHDPLLRQVLITAAEEQRVAGFSADPVGDLRAMTVPGLLHKYHGRALLLTTGTCAIHCRYCFRRHFPYQETKAADPGWEAALAYIAADPTIAEIILSGGDPLTLSDPKLAALVSRLERLPGLKRLRIHTRLPIVLPERVTPELVALLGETRLKSVVVVHANHPQELDGGQVRQALLALTATGSSILNQTVLLAGINDQADTLARLSEALFDHGVLPYYLHSLDPVQGAAHFRVSDQEARRIVQSLRRRLPGYLVPRLVREVAGEEAKHPL